MAFNGVGVFLRLYSWVNDAASNIKIRADRMDNEMNGMAVGLSTCITKDGQTTVTANLPMAGFRHTSAGDAVNKQDYLTLNQAMNSIGKYPSTVGGTADVITLGFSPTFTAYTTGMQVSFIASGMNTTNVTVNIDTLGAKAITKNGATALVAGDIPSGALVLIEYDGTRFQILNINAANSFGANVLTFLQTPTSANLAAALTNETGTGLVVFNTNAALTTPTVTGLNLAAGTITVAPSTVVSGVLLTTATAGSFEYDGKTSYFTPISTQRGILQSAQLYELNAPFAGSNTTPAQTLLNVGVTVSSSIRYEFEAEYFMSKTAGTTSHNMSLLYGGTATFTDINYSFISVFGAAQIGGASSFGAIAVATNTQVNPVAMTGATQFGTIRVHGFMTINAGGTIIPQYALSAAPGGAWSTGIASYFKIWPVGASGANINIGTWI